MTKKKLFRFLGMLAVYVICLVILQLIAKKNGWTDVSVRDNIIGLTVAWVLWYGIMAIRRKKSAGEKDK